MAKRRIIETHVAMYGSDEVEASEIDKLTGKTEEEAVSWGECVFFLDEVIGVSQYFPDDEDTPDEDKSNVAFSTGKSWTVTIPYKEMKAMFLGTQDEDLGDKSIDLGHAILTLAENLKNDPALRQGYKDNIAMSFTSAYMNKISSITSAGNIELPQSVVELANQGAENFLNKLTESVK